MNTEHLPYILEVCRCGSVNKAAKNLYISQSNLSSIIKNIETEVGYALFKRGGAGIALTPEGRLFVRHAESIIAESRNIQQIPLAFEENKNLSILSAPASFLVQCFFDFKKESQDELTQDTFIEAGIKDTLKGIMEQRCRLGLLVLFEQNLEKYALMAQNYNLTTKVLKADIPMVVFMSKFHALAKKEKLYKADLLHYPFVRDSQIDYEDTLDAFNIIDAHNLLYISGRSTCLDAVRKGMYLSIGIGLPKQDNAMYQCLCRPVADISERMSVVLLKPEFSELSVRESRFIAYLTGRLEKEYGRR